MPLRIPPGPPRMRPWKPLWNCSNPPFPQKKQDTETVHLCLQAASEHADTKSTRSDGPTGHTLSCFPPLEEKTELLTFETLQLVRQVLLIPVFLVLQVFLRDETKKRDLQVWTETVGRARGARHEASKGGVAPTAITLIWSFCQKHPAHSLRNLRFPPERRSSLVFSLSRTLHEGVGEKSPGGGLRMKL